MTITMEFCICFMDLKGQKFDLFDVISQTTLLRIQKTVAMKLHRSTFPLIRLCIFNRLNCLDLCSFILLFKYYQIEYLQIIKMQINRKIIDIKSIKNNKIITYLNIIILIAINLINFLSLPPNGYLDCFSRVIYLNIHHYCGGVQRNLAPNNSTTHSNDHKNVHILLVCFEQFFPRKFVKLLFCPQRKEFIRIVSLSNLQIQIEQYKNIKLALLRTKECDNLQNLRI